MNPIRLLARGLLLLASMPCVVAQQEGPKKEEPTTTTVQVKTTKLLRAGADLVGMTLVTPKDEPLGKVEDLIIHPKGDVAFVEVSGAGALNTGTRRFPVPWHALTRNENGQLQLATTPQAFVKLPDFEKRPKLDDVGWWMDVDRAYAKIVKEKATPVEASTSLAPTKMLYVASDLRSREIESPDGEKLAAVNELVIDPRAGRVAYVVIGVGGNLGADQKMVAVPWEALKPMPDKSNPKISRLTLSTTREKLADAPEFQTTTEGWTKASEPDYVVRVYEFYSIPLYGPVEKSTSEPKKQ